MINNINQTYENISTFLKDLEKDNQYTFYPSSSGVTEYGKKLNLGFSTFGLKIRYMLGDLSTLGYENTQNWAEYICSFQTKQENHPSNYFIDEALIDFYADGGAKEFVKDKIKNLLNTTIGKNFDTFSNKLNKALNAETKQAISTLHQIGFENYEPIEPPYTKDQLFLYLKSLNWMYPWSAGAQFSSMCVYTTTEKLDYEEILVKFINQIADIETGSYFSTKPNHPREIINGAMKVLSGLDWIDEEIHYPEALIDFCLNNSPISEGCDIVDFIYVLFRCSQQSPYKKKEINNKLLSISDDIEKLYFRDIGGFSYFPNKSQTHYYGVDITDGSNVPDVHGTTLSLWALNMILKNNELLDNKYNIIKP